MTLASRLVEDQKVTVAVLEAGVAHPNDPKVLRGGPLAAILGDPEVGHPSPSWSFNHRVNSSSLVQLVLPDNSSEASQ